MQGDIGESCFFVSLEDELLEEASWFSIQAIKDAARVQRHIEGLEENSRLVLSKYGYLLEKQRQIITNYRNRVLFDREPANLLQNKEKELYEGLVNKAGKKGVSLAEKQLLLYFTNLHSDERFPVLNF